MKKIFFIASLSLLIGCINNPEDIAHYHNKAIDCYLKEDLKCAFKNARKATDISHHKNQYSLLFTISHAQKDYKALLQVTDEALQYKENHIPLFYIQNGFALELNNKNAEAKNRYKTALDIWNSREIDSTNIHEAMSEIPVLTSILSNKNKGLLELNKIYNLSKKSEIETLLYNEHKKFIKNYNGSGMTSFYDQITP